MKTALFLFLTISFQILFAQDLKLVKGQYDAILKAKTVDEKLMRACKLSGRIPSLDIDAYDLDKKELNQNTDLSELDGFSDLLDENKKIRIITWGFPLKDGAYQYYLGYICKLDSTGISWSGSAGFCDNDLDVNCSPCRLSSYHPDKWDGTIYKEISSNYEDSLLYVVLIGEQYSGKDTVTVRHRYSVSSTCKVNQLLEGSNDAVR